MRRPRVLVVESEAASDVARALEREGRFAVERCATVRSAFDRATDPAQAGPCSVIVEAGLLVGLEESRDRAECAAREQSSFVAAVSHEIRTPLAAILGMADLLAQTALDPGQREYVEVFRRCGRSLKGILDAALELSRLDDERAPLAREPFEVDDLVYECAEAFAFAAHRKGLALVVEVADEATGSAVGDEGRLRQVLFNLIGNAVKFTEAGRVVVRARVAEGRAASLVLEVADTGIGIAEDRHEAIFERFVQADSGTTRRFGGSGLGLALARELVAAMGGQIGVESAPGAGSTFRVALPLAVDARSGGPGLAGRRILVLLADAVERRTAVERLRRRGAAVEEVASAEEAERRLVTGLPWDGLLVDARLAGGGGLALLERRDLHPRLSRTHRVVLLAMDHRAGDLARCAAAGAAAFTKPARWDDLDEALVGRHRRTPRALDGDTAAPVLSGRRILLAEDVEENRTIVLAHLRPTGCAVDVALDGREAVERWQSGGYDLVLMDVHMPRLDGCEATRRIRALERERARRRTPIVALTADALPEQRAACQTAGCDAHLGKPFTRGDLYRVLLRHLLAGGAPADALSEIPAEVADLAEEYLHSRRRDAQAIQRAGAQRDFACARRLGHNMKGSGGGYGFDRVTELGAEIERAAADEDAEALERAARALSEFAEKMLAALA